MRDDLEFEFGIEASSVQPDNYTFAVSTNDIYRVTRVVDVSSRTALSVLIGPLALALMSSPSQAGICDPLSHLGRTCQEGDHILAPGRQAKVLDV